jgi:hypothetical protein
MLPVRELSLSITCLTFCDISPWSLVPSRKRLDNPTIAGYSHVISHIDIGPSKLRLFGDF